MFPRPLARCIVAVLFTVSAVLYAVRLRRAGRRLYGWHSALQLCSKRASRTRPDLTSDDQLTQAGLPAAGYPHQLHGNYIYAGCSPVATVALSTAVLDGVQPCLTAKYWNWRSCPPSSWQAAIWHPPVHMRLSRTRAEQIVPHDPQLTGSVDELHCPAHMVGGDQVSNWNTGESSMSASTSRSKSAAIQPLPSGVESIRAAVRPGGTGRARLHLSAPPFAAIKSLA